MSCLNDGKTINHTGLNRRRFLKLSTAGALVAALPGPAIAAVRCFSDPSRALSIYNTHTGETFQGVYWFRGRYLWESLDRIDRVLRDHRTGEVRAIDPRLLDLLHTLGKNLDARHPFHVISGYRSPQTNAMLRAQGRGVAGKSLHMKGKAIDINLPDCAVSVLHRAAMEQRRGGVGYYPGPGFVHIDVGRVRSW